MEELRQVEETRGDRCHRMECEFTVVNSEFVGIRGGRKVPIEIVWKPAGYGLGTTVFRTCGCAVLFPYVRYHNGNGKPRTMEVSDWVKLTGQGAFKRTVPQSEAFEQKLLECETEREKYGGRVAEIVTSIMANGGTLRISNR